MFFYGKIVTNIFMVITTHTFHDGNAVTNIFCVVFTKNIVTILLKINFVSILPQITSERKNTLAYFKRVNFGKKYVEITVTKIP